MYFWLDSRSGNRFLFRTAAILFHVDVENEWKCSLINVEWALVTKLASWWRQRPPSLHITYVYIYLRCSLRTHSCNPHHGWKWWGFSMGFVCVLCGSVVLPEQRPDIYRPYKQRSPMPPPNDIWLLRRATTWKWLILIAHKKKYDRIDGPYPVWRIFFFFHSYTTRKMLLATYCRLSHTHHIDETPARTHTHTHEYPTAHTQHIITSPIHFFSFWFRLLATIIRLFCCCTYSSCSSVMVWYINKYPNNISEQHCFHHF